MLNKIVIPLLVLLFASCVEEVAIIQKVGEEPSKDDMAVSALSEALNEADLLREEIYGEAVSTRGAGISIQPILKAMTRTTNDTVYYIVNYGEDEGYAVITTVAGLEKVQAVSDKGSLSINDTVGNKGLASFFCNLEANINKANALHADADTTLHGFQPTVRNEGVEKVKPKLTSTVRNWHQDSPYNQNCPDYLTTPKKVGCMALSMAQILSYHEWPDAISGVTLNWNNIKTSAYTLQTYELLAILGSSQYLNLSYGVNSTIGYETYVIPTFIKVGYSQLNSPKDFAEASACLDIKSNGPLLVYTYNGSMGHAWVIDGYIRKYCERWEQKVSGVGEYEWVLYNSYLFHCVWGEAKVGDGYFRWDYLNDGIGGDAPELREVDDRKGPGAVLYRPHYYTGFAKK